MACNLELRLRQKFPLDSPARLRRQVLNLSAGLTPYMVMIEYRLVESLLATRKFKFPDETGLAQSIEVTVHGREADLRKLLPDKIVQFVRGRVRLAPVEDVEYDPPLPGHLDIFSHIYHVDLIANNNYSQIVHDKNEAVNGVK